MMSSPVHNVPARTTLRLRAGWPSVARNGLAIVGLCTVVHLGMEAVLPAPDGEPAMPLAAAVAEPLPTEATAVAVARALDAREKSLSRFLARYYRIASEAADELVGVAFDAAKNARIDPILLLAVMAVESRFNPIAQSDMGAKGLMQIIPRFHLEKFASFGGEETVLDPTVNIFVGARILREYSEQAGDVEAGLQQYNGAANDPARQYAERVWAEYDRIGAVVGKRRPPAKSVTAPAPVASDASAGQLERVLPAVLPAVVPRQSLSPGEVPVAPAAEQTASAT